MSITSAVRCTGYVSYETSQDPPLRDAPTCPKVWKRTAAVGLMTILCGVVVALPPPHATTLHARVATTRPSEARSVLPAPARLGGAGQAFWRAMASRRNAVPESTPRTRISLGGGHKQPNVAASKGLIWSGLLILLGAACASVRALRQSPRVLASKPQPLAMCSVAGFPDDSQNHLWALDFDGVLCDTEPESSMSGWRAAARYWPELFAAATPEDEEDVLGKMAKLRPIVETGYENMILARLMFEELAASRRARDIGSRPLTVGEVSANWGELLPRLMDKWGLDRQEMIDYFGQVRDDWMAEDLDGWLRPNRMYQGVVEALNASSVDMYIITTKQQRFAHALLKDAGCTKFLDKSKIYGLGMGTKTEVMADLQRRAEFEGRTLHFIEDRLKTLQAVIGKGPELGSWQLYLCDWGYNSPSDRNQALVEDRIAGVDLAEFCDLLQRPKKWTAQVMPKVGKGEGVTIGFGP